MILRVSILFLFLTLLSQGAEAFTHAFSPIVPDVTCNFLTGVATGVGAGTCIASPAVCTGAGGVATDSAALTAFRTWAVGTWQATHSGLVELLIPPGSNCHVNSLADSTMFDGIIRLLVEGTGASLTSDGQIVFFGGAGLDASNGVDSHCATIQSVSAGAAQVTALTPAQASRVTVGNYALVMGFDMQGLKGGNFGYPPNPGFFDFVPVTSVNTTTGVVNFSVPLTENYKSTWPKISQDPGPASICPLPTSWNIEHEYRGFTFTQGQNVGSNANGRKITFRNVVFANSSPNVSQNLEHHLINVSCPTCLIEIDKIVGTLDIQRGTYSTLQSQSSSVKALIVNGAVVSTRLDGTPRSFIGSNITINDTRVGTLAFGGTKSFSCTNCILGASNLTIGGVLETGPGAIAAGIQNSYSMSGGIIAVPNGTTASAAVDNGSGATRFTVVSTGGFITGKIMTVQGVNGAAFTGTGSGTNLTASGINPGQINPGDPVCGTGVPANTSIVSQTSGSTGGDGVYVTNNATTSVGASLTSGVSGGIYTGAGSQESVTVIDGTHLDVPVAIGCGFGTNSGGLIWPGNPLNWALPGANLWWSGSQASETSFRVLDVAQDANNILIQTDQSGGFPPIDLGASNKLSIRVHPAPVWDCHTCSGGSAQVIEMQGAPNGAPLGSWVQFTCTGASGAGTCAQPFVVGNLSSIDVNVTQAYTGAGGLSFTLAVGGSGWPVTNSAFALTAYNPVFNSKTVGTRHITLTSQTGTQVGDSGLAPPDSTVTWFGGTSFGGSRFSADVSTSCPGAGCPSVTVTMQANQGVIP